MSRRIGDSQEKPSGSNGAIDVFACPYRARGHKNCLCLPKCAACGFGPHSAVHGPVYGERPGSKPYDHEYKIHLEA